MKRIVLNRPAAMLGLLTAALIGCKSASTVTYVPTFKMDLSAYRPHIPEPQAVQPESLSNTANDGVAQTASQVSITGSIEPQLNALREAMAAANKKLKFSQGYRVVVYSGSNREEANKVMNDVRKIASETPELVYEQPNFRVKLGNFFSRADAFALYTRIRPAYPNAVIVNERITIPIEKYRSN